MINLVNPNYDKVVFVLKPKLSSDDAEELVENKKINSFKFLLQKPKKSDVRVISFKLYYEAFLLLAGKYTADFIRKANHTINVDNDVREVVIDQNTYPNSGYFIDVKDYYSDEVSHTRFVNVDED